MEFKFNNQSVLTAFVPLAVKNVIKYLDTLPLGEFQGSSAVGSALGKGNNYVSHSAQHPLLADYQVLGSCKAWWGSKQTVAAWRKKENEEKKKKTKRN